MARILVADDNSNVQKTVTLALAGLGMDVVSVNNGEAAVRKLPDFSPDLVLADIFMPVRNGYEVCEFIKRDPRFSHVPVVLLVGAFDPLDEREAQRVGADGILKKPFVPPDPLIGMVKTLLDRTSGERLVAVSAPKAAATVQERAGSKAVAEVQAPAPEISEELSSPEFPSPMERVAFGEGAHPVAFGTLLETPSQDAAAPHTPALEPVDDEQILTSSRDATLGDPIFWRNDSNDPEAEPETVPSNEASSGVEIPAWKAEEHSQPSHDQENSLQPVEPLELVRDEQNDASPSVVSPESILQDPAALARLTVEPDKAEDLAENPLEWMATAPNEHPEAGAEAAVEPAPGSDEAIPEAANTIDRAESARPSPEFAPGPDPDPVPDFVPALVPDLSPVSARVSAESQAPMSVPVVTPVDVVVAEKAPEHVAAAEASIPLAPPPKIELNHSTQSASDTARSIPKKDWADLTASIQASMAGPVSQQIRPEPSSGGNSQAPASHAPEDAPDAALVEAVVQRVLDKMRPQVVDIITKEFLRPIVQALVHREIDKH